MKQSESFSKWYRTHRQDISEKRKRKYREDPRYRELINLRVKKYRESRRKPIPKGYNSLSDTANMLGVTANHIYQWRHKKFFPETEKIGNRVYFTDNQVSLLNTLKEVLQSKGKLENVIDFVYANWS